MLIFNEIWHLACPKCCPLSFSTESASETGSGTMCQSDGAMKALMELKGCAVGD